MHLQLTTVCYINEIPRTQAERMCRKDLDLYLDKNKKSLCAEKAPKVVLSHVPLHIASTRHFHQLREMVLEIQPNYIFSGHIHHESYSTHIMWEEGKRGRSVKKLAHEITVPTCSYRMGEMSIGAGVAVIGKLVTNCFACGVLLILACIIMCFCRERWLGISCDLVASKISPPCKLHCDTVSATLVVLLCVLWQVQAECLQLASSCLASHKASRRTSSDHHCFFLCVW